MFNRGPKKPEEFIIKDCALWPHAPTAIPEEVGGFLQTCISNMVVKAFELGGDSKIEILGKVDIARRWLESMPVATDKAVCPECGHKFNPADDDGMFYEEVTCPKCEASFDVRVVITVISPPREVKP